MIGPLLLGFVLLALLGVPMAVAMGVAVAVTMAFFTPFPVLGVIQRMVTGIDSYVLISIPFFMLTGRLMNAGGITNDLFRFARSLVGPIRGGLAHANVIANMILAGMSGSAVADAGGMGVVVIKAMHEQGYRKELAAAITVAASTIGPIIPPSIPMVIYGAMAEVSVGRLFLGGFVPGVLMGLGLMVLIYFFGFREHLPKDKRYTLLEIGRAFRSAFLSLLTPVILIGGILRGIFTPTEASAVAAVYAFVICFFLYKTVTLRDIPSIIVDTFVTTAVVTFIISATSGFSYLLIVGKIGTLLVDSTLALTPRSRRARPSPAAAWLHGPPMPEPRMRRVSSPMTALVLDWPPSTPRNNRMAGMAIILRGSRGRVHGGLPLFRRFAIPSDRPIFRRRESRCRSPR